MKILNNNSENRSVEDNSAFQVEMAKHFKRSDRTYHIKNKLSIAATS